MSGETELRLPAESITLNGNGHANCERAVTANVTELTQAVRNIAVDRSIHKFDKCRQIADLVERELKTLGLFRSTRDGKLFYFLNSERRLLNLDQRPFHHLLKSLSGLAAPEAFFRFVLERLRNAAEQTQPLEVHTLSYYDAKTGLLVVSDGGRGVWRREPKGTWRPGLNGEDGIFFLTDINADTWEPEFSSDDHMSWFLKQFNFTDYASRVFRPDQTSLYLLNFRYWFFPTPRKSRMIPVFLGPQGSGKSTALRLTGSLLVGPRFEVSDVRTDGLDAFIAAGSNQIVCGLDNVDAKIPRLQDALSHYANGLRFNRRSHRSTNEIVSYEPRAILILSSRYPHFTLDNIAEHILPLYCARPEQFVRESVIFDELARRRGAIMGDLLQSLGSIADGLAQSAASPVPFRMAEFGSFLLWLTGNNTKEGLRLLNRLRVAQADYTSEVDDIIAVLRELLGSVEQFGPYAVGEVFAQCNKIAKERDLNLPKTVQGFGQRISNLRPVIEMELNARFSEMRVHSNRRIITIIRLKDKSKSAGSMESTTSAG